MTKIYELRNKFSLYKLRKRTQKSKVKRETISFGRAKTVGIIYTDERGDNTAPVKRFIKAIEKDGKKVQTLVYKGAIKEEEIQNKPKNEVVLIRKQMSFWYEPRGKEVKQFIKTPFDILINLDIKGKTCLGYVSGMSFAKFRIGRYSKTLSECHDFMITFENDKSLEFFIEQITHYLKIIKLENEKV